MLAAAMVWHATGLTAAQRNTLGAWLRVRWGVSSPRLPTVVTAPFTPVGFTPPPTADVRLDRIPYTDLATGNPPLVTGTVPYDTNRGRVAGGGTASFVEVAAGQPRGYLRCTGGGGGWVLTGAFRLEVWVWIDPIRPSWNGFGCVFCLNTFQNGIMMYYEGVEAGGGMLYVNGVLYRQAWPRGRWFKYAVERDRVNSLTAAVDDVNIMTVTIASIINTNSNADLWIGSPGGGAGSQQGLIGNVASLTISKL